MARAPGPVLGSRAADIVANPVAGFGLLMVAFVLPYPSGGYAIALDQWAVHDLWHLALIGLSMLLFLPLLGLDPVPGRLPHLFRQAMLLFSVPVSVAIGFSVLNSDSVFAADHFAILGRGWGPDVRADQAVGGAVFAWAGNALSIILGFVLLVRWMRDEDRRTRRLDREHDRLVAAGQGHDTELGQYDAWLERLHRDQHNRRP